MAVSLANPISATTRVLATNAQLVNLVGGRIYGAELPGSQAPSMPRAAIVVSRAGGPGNADLLGVVRDRVDVRCYGASQLEADTVANLARYVLRRWERRTVNGLMVVDFTVEAGATSYRTPDHDWPVTAQSYQVQYAEQFVS